MPRASLRAAVVVLIAATAGVEAALDPHLDPALVPGSCSACHRGHGEPGSPMLGKPQAELCLDCHGTRAARDDAIRRGMVAAVPGAEILLDSAISQPFSHPISAHAFSRVESNVVTCTSCHSPHRRSTSGSRVGATGPGPRASTLTPDLLEYELCLGCHDDGGPARGSGPAVGRLVDPTSVSFHPVVAPAAERSSSVVPAMSGSAINCTDCHGNDDPGGAAGPHGSNVAGLLRAGYSSVDGGAESFESYALCYRCHDRQSVLRSSTFPEHYRHVVDLRTSCATCHDPHGSLDSPALIRIGANSLSAALMPSVSAGVLSYESYGAGAGACWLSCHGYDHSPEVYGTAPPVDTPEQPGTTLGEMPSEGDFDQDRPGGPDRRR